MKCLFCEFDGTRDALMAHSAECESHPLWLERERLRTKLWELGERLDKRDLVLATLAANLKKIEQEHIRLASELGVELPGSTPDDGEDRKPS